MAEETENHAIRLLQEIRADMRELRGEMNDRVDELNLKIDGNTVLLNLVAGVAHDHEQRLGALEGKTQS